jgi:hypothetical protein
VAFVLRKIASDECEQKLGPELGSQHFSFFCEAAGKKLECWWHCLAAL